MIKQPTSTGLTRTEKDHDKVNKNIFEICFLLKLLNNEYDLELKKPAKQSNQTLQFLRLTVIRQQGTKFSKILAENNIFSVEF